MSLLKADTIKPVTSSGDLSLQGDSGGSAVDCLNITSAGDINFSGNTNAKIKLPTAGGVYKGASDTAILTESGGAVTLDNVAIGSSVTGISAGKVLQVLQYVGTTTQAGFSSATYADVTDVTGAITITASNIVVCICNPAISAQGGGVDGGLGLQLYDSTNAAEIVATSFYMFARDTHVFTSGGAWTLLRKFTPASTTLTVKLRAKVTDGMTPTLSGGTLILMEVAA